MVEQAQISKLKPGLALHGSIWSAGSLWECNQVRLDDNIRWVTTFWIKTWGAHALMVAMPTEKALRALQLCLCTTSCTAAQDVQDAAQSGQECAAA